MKMPLLTLLELSGIKPGTDVTAYQDVFVEEIRLAEGEKNKQEENVLYFSSPKAPDSQLFHLFNKLLDSAQKLRRLENRLKIKAAQGGLQSSIELISESMGNPAYITDSSFKVLAIDRTPFLSEISSIWKHISTDGYLSYDIVHHLRVNGELEQLGQGERAKLIRSEAFNNPFISYGLKKKGKLCGYLFVVGYLKKITPGEIELAKVLGDMLVDLCPDTLEPSDILGRDYENFIIHSLSGEPHDPEQTAKQLKPLGWKSDEKYCVVRIETGTKDDILQRNLCGELEKMGDIVSLVYQKGIVAVFRLSDDHSLCKITEELKRLVAHRGCYCGISDSFRGFQNLSHYYRQAIAALTYGYTIQEQTNNNSMNNNNNNLEKPGFVTPYTSCAAEQLFTMCPLQALDDYCWNELKELSIYDKNHQTDYLATLSCYLENECSIASTARRLYIHRNTLIYRLSRLTALLDCSLDNPATRDRLRLSLEIIKNIPAIASDKL